MLSQAYERRARLLAALAAALAAHRAPRGTPAQFF